MTARPSAAYRGAVLAEAVIALVPVLVASLSFLQVTKLRIAKLCVSHAAIVAARSAAVTSSARGNNPGVPAGDRRAERAALAALRPWIEAGSLADVRVDVHDASSLDDPRGPVRVTVSAAAACAVPMVGRGICAGPRKLLTAEASLPHQGAVYADEGAP